MVTLRKPIESLARLNRQARERSFDIEDIDWGRSVERARPWMPEPLGLLYYATSYRRLDAGVRRRYNQLAALSLCEQFILFEQAVIRALPGVLARRDLPAELRESLRHFIVEEQKHIEMFWRLLERSEPGFYRKRTPKLALPSLFHSVMMDCAVSSPRLFLAWIWLTIFLEERTLFVSRQFLRAQRQMPETIDPLHAEVHAFHFKDEVRHCQIDQHLLTVLYDPQPRWKKSLCGEMFHHALRAFVFPGRSTRRILALLGKELPYLRDSVIPRLLAELPQIGASPEFHMNLFSPTALPRTLRLISLYPEHAEARRLLPLAPWALTRSDAGVAAPGR
ncbi:MAG TPA: diiron oxygenase [Gammaproteobacteria bacterium]|nr:diiron oxygenase [Gammaproteobacteria bacterium]